MGYTWLHIVIHDYNYNYMGSTWVLHGSTWFYMVLHDSTWFYMGHVSHELSGLCTPKVSPEILGSSKAQSCRLWPMALCCLEARGPEMELRE